MGILRLLINLFSQNDRLQKESLNPVDVRALIVDAALKYWANCKNMAGPWSAKAHRQPIYL